jgi:hypothetical protein
MSEDPPFREGNRPRCIGETAPGIYGPNIHVQGRRRVFKFLVKRRILSSSSAGGPSKLVSQRTLKIDLSEMVFQLLEFSRHDVLVCLGEFA